MARHKAEGKEKGMLKRMRRARGGRRLPQNGAGVHEDKRSKKVERQRAEDLDDEIKNWQQLVATDLEEELEDNADITDQEFWDEWKYPDDLYDDWDEE